MASDKDKPLMIYNYQVELPSGKTLSVEGDPSELPAFAQMTLEPVRNTEYYCPLCNHRLPIESDLELWATSIQHAGDSWQQCSHCNRHFNSSQIIRRRNVHQKVMPERIVNEKE